MASIQEAYRVISRSSQVDERRARYTVYVSWVLLPVIVIFPMSQEYTGILAGTLLGLALIIILANIIVYNSTWQTGKRLLPFIGGVSAAVTLLYFLWLGYEGGSSFVWIYVFPLIVMFMLGIFWGSIGCLLVLLLSLAFMLGGSEFGSFDYAAPLVSRFGLSFSLVAALAFGFEYWRVALEMEKESISAELDQMRVEHNVLKGLARVCSWCSSVRADDGRWLTIDSYVSGKEEAQISHCICPKCVEKEAARIKNKSA